MTPADIQRRIAAFQHDNFLVLIGAGASVPSGIASGQILVRTLLPFLIPDNLRKRSSMDNLLDESTARRIRFEQLVQIIRDETDPQLLVIQYMEQSWTPSYLHYWASDCLRAGVPVVTTNLDSLIEAALLAKTGGLPEQLLREEDYRRYSKGMISGPVLFKLHGTIRRADYLHKARLERQAKKVDEFASLTERDLETFQVSLDKIGVLEKRFASGSSRFLLPDYVLETLARVLQGRDLVVVGYSGSDDFDIKPSLNLLRDRFSRVFWIAHTNSPLVKVKTCGRFCLLKGQTSAALRLLQLVPDAPTQVPVPDTRSRLERFCRKWADRAHVTENDKTIIVGLLLSSLQPLSNAIGVWEDGLEDVYSWDICTAARYYFLLGDAYFRERDYERAEEVYTLALQRSSELQDTEGCDAAQLALEEIKWISGVFRDDAHLRDQAVKNLADLVRRAEEAGPEYLEFKVRATVALCRIVRQSAGMLPDELPGQEIHGLHCLFTVAMDLFSRNKALYAEVLKEAALHSLLANDTATFWKYRAEVQRLYQLLNLRLELGDFMLDVGLICARRSVIGALDAFKIAEQIFKSLRCEVGIAEAYEARAVLELDVETSKTLLMKATTIYIRYSLFQDMSRGLFLMAGVAMLAGKPDAAVKYCEEAVKHTEFFGLKKLQSLSREYPSLILLAKTPTADIVRRCWAEFRRPVRQALVSDYVPNDRACPDYFNLHSANGTQNGLGR